MAEPRHLVARLSARVRRCRESSACAARPPADRGLAGSPGLAGGERAAARPGRSPRAATATTPSTTSRSTPGSATGEDFDRLVAACHDRGIRVLLDGVFNHAGREFPPVARALAEGPGSASADWVRKLYDNDGLVTADYFEGHDTLVTLNHASPQVQQFVRDVMLHWLRRGIDGWRLDAAYAVPAEFWAACCRRSAGSSARRGSWGDDPRRLCRLRRGVGDRLGDPVRDVEGDLVRPGHGQPARAGLDAGPAPRPPRAPGPDDLPEQPRRDPGGQPDPRPTPSQPRGRPARLPARGAERLLRRRVRPGGGQGATARRRRRRPARAAEGPRAVRQPPPGGRGRVPAGPRNAAAELLAGGRGDHHRRRRQRPPRRPGRRPAPAGPAAQPGAQPGDRPYAAPDGGELVESSAPLVGGAVAPHSWAVLAPSGARS